MIRRDFLKGFSVAFLALGFESLNANLHKNSNFYATYFIKDLQCIVDSMQNVIVADRVLTINGDIGDIYAELKRAFQSNAIVASQSSEATFFVISTMAAGFGFYVAYSDRQNGVHSWILAPTNIKI